MTKRRKKYQYTKSPTDQNVEGNSLKMKETLEPIMHMTIVNHISFLIISLAKIR